MFQIWWRCLIDINNNYLQNQHAGATSIDIKLLPFVKDQLNVGSLLDIGCGPGGNVEFARHLGIQAYGVDGDINVLPKKAYFEYVDYSRGYSSFIQKFDLGWSVEFAEHIAERYIPNFMMDYKKCSRVIFTAAPPGWGGNGHVNEQKKNYWIKKFEKNGFNFNVDMTKKIRQLSLLIFQGSIRLPKKQFIQNRGLVFDNLNISGDK